METQQVETTEKEEHVPGVGEQQSKLAIRLRDDKKLLTDAYLYNRKSRHVSAPPLARALMQSDALSVAVKTMVHCLETHEDREDFARSMLEAMKHA